jgi:Cyclin, N-terminal domain
MEERNIFFMVTRLVDAFYRHKNTPQPKQELQLTAISSIFMASKLVQINHVNLQFCYSNIGHQKFTLNQINDRETGIMKTVEWEVTSSPTVYEVFEFLMMLVRSRLHEHIYCNETEKFVSDIHSLGL